MVISGVHHVSLNVADAATAIRFYVDVLGFSERDDRPEMGLTGAWLQAGEQQIHLLEVADFVPQRGPHFALRVDDIDAALDEIRGHGVKVSEPARVGDICRQCFFTDPSGNLVELNQPL